MTSHAIAIITNDSPRAAPVASVSLDPPASIRQRLADWTPSLVPLAERLALAAAHDVTVLMTGETGTGKTYLARIIHDYSPRAGQPFVVVPCGAIPSTLLESTFFGHVKGAFTGADRPIAGKFAAAGNGTLLLDEIDSLGLEEQVKLLRVLETGEYEPVGSTTTHRCGARVVVTSNANLEELVAQGKFRWDLYYRIHVMTFGLLPLRERPEDVAPLARGMAARFAVKFRRDPRDIHPEALAALKAFPWPGNIRQLENAMQQAVLVCPGPELQLEHLPQPVQENLFRCNFRTDGPGEGLLVNRDAQERNVIQQALASVGFSRSRAADRLGVSRVTLYRKMKKYGLLAGRFGQG